MLLCVSEILPDYTTHIPGDSHLHMLLEIIISYIHTIPRTDKPLMKHIQAVLFACKIMFTNCFITHPKKNDTL